MTTPSLVGEKFHAHVDVCAQCRTNPFELCHKGAELLNQAASHLPVAPEVEAEEKFPKSAHEWLQGALGRYQVTHIHSSIREALKAMEITEADSRWPVTPEQDDSLQHESRVRYEGEDDIAPLPTPPAPTESLTAVCHCATKPTFLCSVHGLPFSRPTKATPSAPTELNQCDGCNLGLPLDDKGNHLREGAVFGIHQFCTKFKYAASTPTEAELPVTVWTPSPHVVGRMKKVTTPNASLRHYIKFTDYQAALQQIAGLKDDAEMWKQESFARERKIAQMKEREQKCIPALIGLGKITEGEARALAEAVSCHLGFGHISLLTSQEGK